MKYIKEDMSAAAVPATNNTTGIASLNPNDPKNPPVFKKKSPKILKQILRRAIPK